MRIALLQTPTFTLNIEYHGGIERVELGQLELLARHGHAAHLFVPKMIGKKSNVVTIKAYNWHHRFIKWVYYIKFWFIARRYDVCHGHYTPELLTLLPGKSVLYFHGLAVKELPLYRYPAFRKRYHRAHYTFCAQWVKEEYQKLYPEIPEANLHVLHYGCNVDHFIPMNDKQSDPHSGLKICWYGLWEDPKGVFDLLAAFEVVKKERNDVGLSIGGSAFYEGDTKEAERIEKEVREWGNRLNVEIAGKIKYADLPTFINKHDVGIFPSKYRDPFPSVPLEMMACGLPVIAYDYGGPRECIKDGSTGFLVENGNVGMLAERIRWFAAHTEKAREMGLNARKHMMGTFTWEHHYDKLMVIYDQVVTRKKYGSKAGDRT